LGFVLLPTVTKRPFCLVIGERDTGKTTLKEVLKCVLNDFVAVSTLDSIQERFGLAKLVGKRLVISSERPRRLVDVEIIKRLTGGETISVEMKFKDPFEAVIDPVFIFLMNSAPRFKKLDDEAFLQRFVVIETSNPLTPEEKDRRVREKLLQNPEDILLYLIWCYIELLKRNLIIPQDETEVMEVLLSGLGDVRDFFDEVVEVEFGEVIEGSGLYDFYTYWCAQNGRHVVSRNRFYQDFTEIGARRGVLKGRNSKNKSVCFLNVKIKDEFKREFELLKKVSDNEEKGGREEPPLEEFSRDEESEVKQIEMKDSEENSERSLCYSPALRWEENTRAIEHSIFADERFENMRIELLHALERGDLDHATQTLFKTIRDRVYARDPEVGIKFRKILSGDKERNEIKLLKDILAFFETHRERILKKLKEEVETDG
jgi:P4 family phage/plasmid primase-like protien